MKNITQTLKRIYLLPLFVLFFANAIGQNAIVGTGFSTNWGGGSCPTGNGDFKYFAASAGSSYGLTTVANGTGDQYFRFGVDWNGTTAQLTRTIGSDDTVIPNTSYTLNTTCTTSGALKYNVPNASYNYVFKTVNAGSAPTGTFVFFEVQGAVRTASTVTQSPLAASVTECKSTVITATLDGALAGGQMVYLRFSKDAWATSTIVAMAGSGITYTAAIPSAINTAGANVSYYVFTSGTTTPSGANADFYTINLNNNTGSNYSYTVAVGGAITLIPDPNFEQALIALGLDCTIDGKVFTSNISGVTLLDIRDKSITSLVGIKDFTNLQKLYCNNEIVGDGNDNAISDLDVSGLTNLRYFYCQNNRITNLNITGLTSLEALDTSNNPFSTTALDVHLFPNLYYLVCQNNGLTSLNISGLKNLQTLITWHNSLSSLDVSANPNLSYLDCDDNSFTSINVNGLTKLKYFYCSYNQLPTINVSGLTNLIELYCNDNLLTSLDIKGLTNLDYFDSTNNPLSCILVDDVAAATAATIAGYWAKDAGAIYSNCDCGNTTTWNGISWDNGAPTSAKSAIIEGDYNLAADIIACSLTVNNNAAVTIPSGSSVSLNGALTVSSGSFTLENNANLIQSTNVANSGNITVKRNSALQVRLDHTLWSSPVTGTQTLIGFSPNTLANRFYNFDTATNKYAATSSTGTFTAGKGVAVRAPNDYTTTPTTFNGVFTGLPNNGPIAVALNATAPGNNLLGNPYPSTIDAAAFVNVANNPAIGGTLYFYAHTLSMDANGIFPAGTNYAVWNSGSGGTAATLGTSGVPANVPNGIIQTGQGFFVQATGTGNVNFTNAMRVNNTVNQFFKTSSTEKEAIERHRIWLNLTNGAGTEFNQILVAYAAGATQDADRDYDGLAFGNSGSALSSKIAGADYAIQGRALPFSADDVVALGFKAAADGNYTISLSAMDGLFLDSQEVLIRDNTTGTVQSLKGTPYTFASTAGVHDSRFELMYSKTLGVSKPAFDTTGVVVYKKESAFHVNTNGIMMKEISVFDMRGRLIAKQSNINGTTSTLSGLSGAHGVLLLKIVSDTNETLTIKVMN